MTLRWEVAEAAALERILGNPPVAGLRLPPGPPQAIYFRDVYCDTAEGELWQRGSRCRLRFAGDGACWLTLWLPGGARLQAPVGETEAAQALTGDSEPALRLRALTDPARLGPWIERNVERRWRVIGVPLVRLPLCDVVGDAIIVRRRDLSARLWEVGLRPRPWGGMASRAVARRLEAAFPLRPTGGDALQRAQAALHAAEARILARELRGEREVALVAVEHGRLGLCRLGAELRLPVDRGSGEAACRAALRRLVGSGEGQLRMLGVVPPASDRAALEVWTARRLHGSAALQWFAPAELLERVGSPLLRDPTTLAALTVAARSPLLPEWSGAAFGGDAGDDAPEAVARASRVTLSEMRTPILTAEQMDPAHAVPEQFLNAEFSWIEFNARVLALAEDPRTPPAARARFLGIVSTNLDDFTATKVAALKQLLTLGRTGPSVDGLEPQETLDAIAIRLRPLIARQYRAFDALLRDGSQAGSGPVLVRWPDLDAAEQAALRARCTDELLPFLSPKALTRAPGHPFPLVGDRRLALLVVLRDRPATPLHYALVEIPEPLPRFLSLPDGRRFLPVEDVVRANLDLLYPGRIIAGAHAFRLTRSGDLQLDEASTANFLQAIEEELARRQLRPAVRVEIEAGTPQPLQDLLQRELRFEESERESTLTPADVYLAPGPVNLGDLREAAVLASLRDYPPFTPTAPFAPDRAIAAQLDERDVLVHHPHDSFAASVERFITEAADDPAVQAIKLTLYRPGGPSAIADALQRAAAAGKDVSVIVELKARFDEARNIAWARSLERAGIHVVTGLVSLKTHAKLALVVRRAAGGRARRYAHVGSGNYNPDTALVYTDVGLFTADERITADIHTLFNELTGSSHAPRTRFRHLLVAPGELLDRLLALIARETAHARAGRPARIRAKLNGLADATVIQALYAASQAGVDVDLVVRGICTLRPGVPGLSERVRVVSILGQFLEHARIYHFANGGAGADEYFLGSADWRPRNLRRRVEAMTPVFDAAARAKLDALLSAELANATAWVLQPDGSYERAAAPTEIPTV
ncbi:MAG TPA: polyphosphate kinase 1 [Gemmatimonadales bacterium]|jgi:polyphosphate kinase|nr:polyphosphate kinase 1 [Gemmatimonadales bacterium]